MEQIDFYDYLRSQFINLESAKEFYIKWKDEWNQNIPDQPEWNFSMRTMAAHISNILEGKKRDDSGIFDTTNYTITKYGPEIFWS